MINVFETTTRYLPDDDGGREVLDTDEDTFDVDADEDGIDTIVRYLQGKGVEFRAWSDPVQIIERDGRPTARAFSVDVYVHPGEGWHEEVCTDVTGTDRSALDEIIRRVDAR